MQLFDFNTLKKDKAYFLLPIILIMGFLLRVYNLGGSSLWFDELKTAGRIDYPFILMLKDLAMSPFPPIYYILMHFWVGIFGISEFSLRFPSLIFSLLTIVVIFKLTKKLFDKETALITALLLALSPYNIDYAREAKMYAMFWFFVILSFYYFYNFVRDNKTPYLIFYGISSLASIYTIYAGFIFIIAQNIIFFLLFFDKRLIKKWLAVQATIALFYLPWSNALAYSAFHAKEIGYGWISQIINCKEFLFSLSMIIVNTRTAPVMVNILLICIYGFLFIYALIHGGKNEHFLLLCIIIPITVLYLTHSLIFPVFIVRYISFIHIPVLILCGRGINKGKKIKYALLMFLFCVTILYQLYPYYKSNVKIYVGPEDWRSLFAAIDQKKDRNSLIAAFSNKDGRAKYLYVTKGIKIYNKNEEIKLLIGKELMKNVLSEKYDSIFLVYFEKPDFNGSIDNYSIAEEHRMNRIGYLLFKKAM